MAKRIGIIAEYNPFHNGHIYQINWIKTNFPNSEIVVIMSGKYVQRGEIAIAPFESRKMHVLNYGVKEVHELPQEYAIQAAHIFAEGAILFASKLNIDAIVFGSETNDVELFYKVANAIYQDEEQYYTLLRKNLKGGISFPKANQLTLEQIVGSSFVLPNDILGLEYVKAIVKNKLPIRAICLERTIPFHGEVPKDNIASATFIRSLIQTNDESYKKYTPMNFEDLEIDRIENYYSEFQEKIKNNSAEELSKIKLVSEGIENLFKKHIHLPTYDEFVEATTSKRYTSSRIKRIILHVLLDIRES